MRCRCLHFLVNSRPVRSDVSDVPQSGLVRLRCSTVDRAATSRWRRWRVGSLLSCVALAGCTPLYVAPSANAPLFVDAGEVDVGGQIGSNGLDVHGGVAVTEDLAVVGAFSSGGVLEDDESHSHTYGEVGFGKFSKFGTGGRLELFGGFGAGSSRGRDIGYNEESRGTYLGPFGQFDVGAGNDIFEVAWANRLRYLRYSYDLLYDNPADVAISAVFWESTFVGRIGFPNLKFEIQLGGVVPAYHSHTDSARPVFSQAASTFGWYPVHLSIGLHGTFGRGESERGD